MKVSLRNKVIKRIFVRYNRIPMCDKIISIIASIMTAVVAIGQSYPDIDIEAVLADTVSIYGIEQRVAADVALPSCAQTDSNMMKLPGGESREMARFVEKMDSVVLFGEGRVNIIHIGGSHVQADMYTHVFRQNIDSLNGSLTPPRGMIFPYTVAKTNNPSNYKVKYGGTWTPARNALKQYALDQGACGILVSTTDTTAWVGVDMNPDSVIRWTATKVHLICSSMKGRVEPVLIVRDSVEVRGQKEETGYVYELGEGIGSLSIAPRFDKMQFAEPDTFVLNGLVMDSDEPGIVYSTIGVNGASVPSYLGCRNFSRDLKLVKPDLAIFAIGINDATAANFTDSLFVANYDSLIYNIRSVAPDCALLFITNNDSYRRVRRKYYVNKNGEVARRGFYELAEKWHSPVWDLYEIMGGEGSMQKWQEEHLAQRDKVHFTRAGYEVVGKMFFNAFMDYYLNYDVEKEEER